MKVLDGTVESIIESQAYRPWFMHRIGHWLGLDCHDGIRISSMGIRSDWSLAWL